MLQYDEQEEMKKNLEQKKEFFLIEMNFDNGNQKIKEQNYGTYITEKNIFEKILEFFQ